MRRLGEFVLHHRRLVMVFWALVFVAGAALSSKTTDNLTVDFSLPGQPGSETAAAIDAALGNGGNTSPYVVTVTMPEGQTVTGHEAEISRAFANIETALPDMRVVDEANTGDSAFRTDD